MKKILKSSLMALFIVAIFFPNYVFSESKSIFPNYEKVPTKIYQNEIFAISIKLLITRDDFTSISTSLTDPNGYKFLNPNSVWTQNKQYFTNTFYLQAKNIPNQLLTGFKFDIFDAEENIIETAILKHQKVDFVKLNADEKFSHVLAKDFKVKSYSANRYDESNIVLTIEIETTMSNLNDFNVSSAPKGIIEQFQTNFINQKAQFSTILPHYERSFDFTYFDLTKNSFELIKIPIKLKSDDVSTHVDINPKENKFKLYKEIALGVLAFLCLIIFIKFRYKILILIVVCIIAYIIYSNNPFNNIKIKAATSVHILPNERMTTLYVIEYDTDAEKLETKNGFVKILLPNGKIGWVKKENVFKN